VKHWRKFSEEIASMVIRYGGSLSGEHGDGQAKAEFLPLMYGAELIHAFKRFKSAWDPHNRMNPGKLIDAYKMDDNLRFGPDYERPLVHSTLQFPEDVGGLGRSLERCIGMGKCRAQQGAMCPSYQVTKEERFSTRGRAHLLHELMRGELISDGWNNPDIRESLEHCLSCKSCKSECPTKVDIASYKAEFMSRHYKVQRRSIGNYTLGRLGNLLPYLSRCSRIVNFLQQTSLASPLKNMLGFAPAQSLPQLEPVSFPAWAKTHANDADAQSYWFGVRQDPTVHLWVDSFSAYYRSNLLRSAISVMTRCGFRVCIARQHFCCGRPLYEQGMLSHAKKQLEQILFNFYPKLKANENVVVLEASCLSVFRDELLRLFSDDQRAQALAARSMTLATFLSGQGIKPKTQLSSAIVHWHCHHKALEIDATDQKWIQDCFDKIVEPEAGCCGMAGSFGLKSTTRSIGQALFDRQLKPTILASDPSIIVVANGFSCYEQIQRNTGRKPLHPVEVIERCV